MILQLLIFVSIGFSVFTRKLEAFWSSQVIECSRTIMEERIIMFGCLRRLSLPFVSVRSIQTLVFPIGIVNRFRNKLNRVNVKNIWTVSSVQHFTSDRWECICGIWFTVLSRNYLNIGYLTRVPKLHSSFLQFACISISATISRKCVIDWTLLERGKCKGGNHMRHFYICIPRVIALL